MKAEAQQLASRSISPEGRLKSRLAHLRRVIPPQGPRICRTPSTQARQPPPQLRPQSCHLPGANHGMQIGVA